MWACAHAGASAGVRAYASVRARDHDRAWSLRKIKMYNLRERKTESSVVMAL